MFTRRFNHMCMWFAFMGIGVYVLYEIATEFKAKGVDSGWALENAGMFPRILAIFIIIMTTIGIGFIVYDTCIKHNPVDTTDGDVVPFDTYACAIAGALIVYVLSLDTLGYYVASTLFVAICLTILRLSGNNIKSLVSICISNCIVSFVIVLLLGWLFETVLIFVLPLGVWGLTLS